MTRPKLSRLSIQRCLALSICAMFTSSQILIPAWAQDAPAVPPISGDAIVTPPVTGSDTTQPVAPVISPISPLAPDSLDLGSADASHAVQITAPVSIQLGGVLNTSGVVQDGSVHIINPGDLVTPAQFLALTQVMANGSQSLLLATQGTAVGGFANLTPTTISSLTTLVIPQNVSLNSIGYTASNPLNVTSGVNLAGSIYTLQTAPDITSVLNLGNLTISAGGLLSGNLPTNIANLGMANLFASGGLTLNIAQNVINSGTIATPGILNINAGGSIINQAVSQTLNSVTAQISAQQVNLLTGVGSILNTGVISAIDAINVSTRSALTNLLVDNQNGVMQSLGAINLRDQAFLEKANLNVLGGSFISQELNLNGGKGNVEVIVDNITGMVNANSATLTLHSASDNLMLGTINATDDPLISNAAAVTINANIATAGSPLSIIAGTDILVSGDNRLINTGAAAANGGNILMVAGAAFTTGGGTLTITGGSLTGGRINLNIAATTDINSLDSRGGTGGGNFNGGNISLISYAGSGASSGTINLPVGFTTTTGGSGTGTNGNYLAVANGVTAAASAITIGPITTGVATGGGGSVILSTSAPTIVGPSVQIDMASGAVTAGSFTSSSTLVNSSILPRAITTNGGAITVQAGNSITTTNTAFTSSRTAGTGTGGNVFVETSTGAINFGTGDIFTNGNSAASGNITIKSGTSLTIDDITAVGTAGNSAGGQLLIITGGSISNLDVVSVNGFGVANAGNINIIAGGDLGMLTGNISANGAGATGNAGTITMVAGAAFTDIPATLTITGQSVTGGQITDTGGTLTASGLGGNTNGGNINLVAFEGSTGSATSGRITRLNTTSVDSRGAGTGTNGSITMIAGDNDAAGAASLTAGSLTTRGGSGSLGVISLGTTTPTLVSGSVVISKASNAITSGSFAATGTVQNADILSTGLATNGANITAVAGSDVTVTTNPITSARTNGSGAGGNILILAGGAISAVSISSNALTNATAGNINLVAGGNITLTGAVTANGAGAAGNGGGVALVSGAAFTNNATTVDITGQSVTGGAITGLGISTAALGGNTNGGNINLVAFEGTTGSATSGRITLTAASTQDSRGAGSGTAGQILNIAGDNDAAGAVSLQTGLINTAGGTGGGGLVTIGTTTPSIVGGTVVVNKTSGATTSGSFAINTAAVQNGDVSVASITTNGAAVVVQAGSDILTTNGTINTSRVSGTGVGGDVTLQASAGAVTMGTGDILTQGASGAAGNIVVIAGTTITIDDISANIASGTGTGGNVLMAGGGIVTIDAITTNGGTNASAGNISLISGSNLVLGASNITAVGAGATGNAGTISLIAGAAFTNAATSVTVTGQSVTGGTITDTGLITATGLGGNTNGGNINLVAFEGSTGSAASGRVTLAVASTLDTRGAGTGNNGSVTILAGDNDAAGAASITVGPIMTRGGSGTGGTVNLGTTTPILVSGTVVFSKTTAGITSGSFAADTTAVQNADISTQAITTNGQNVTLLAGSDILTNNGTIDASRTIGTGVGGNVSLQATAATVAMGTGDILTQGASGNSGNIVVTAGTTITLDDITATNASGTGAGGNVLIASGGTVTLDAISTNGAVDASAGNIAIISGGDVTLGASNITATGSGATGSGGGVTLVAGAAFTNAATSVTVTGQSVAGGAITDTGTITNTGLGGNTNGGDITMVAFEGSTGAAATGRITLPAASTLDTRGAGSGNNGGVTLIAGDNDAAGAVTVTVGPIQTRGGSGTGGVVNIGTTTPTLVGGSVVFSKTTATPTSGSFDVNTAAIQNGDISARAITTNGANVTLRAGSDITTNSNAISTNRTSGVGAAGAISLIAATSIATTSLSADGTVAGTSGGSILASLTAAGTLQVSGSVTANGTGAGGGGTVDLRYNAAAGALNIGSVVGTNFVTGNVTADSSGAGNGGIVSIDNNNAAVALTVTGPGDISARSLGAGSLGNLNFFQAGQAVAVNPTGDLRGIVNATGSSVNISSGAVATTLTGGAITASTTAVTLQTNGANSAIDIVGPVSAATAANLTATNIINIRGSLSGATVNLTTGTGGVTETAAGAVTASAGTGVTINMATGGTADLSAGTNNAFRLNGTGTGTIILNNGTNALGLGTFGATQIVNITAAGALTTTASASFASLTANGSSFVQGAGNNYTLTDGTTVNTTGVISLGATYTGGGATSFTSSASNVTVTAGGSLVGAGAKTLSAAAGSISINGAVTGPTTVLTAGAGGISQSAAGVITTTAAGGLTVNLASGGTATLNTAPNNVNELFGTGTGAIILGNGANNLALGTFGGSAQNVTVATTGAITTTGAATTVGTLNLTSGAGGITLSKQLNVSGATLVANSGSIAFNANLSSAGTITATSGTAQSISTAAGATINGTAVTLTTPTLTQNGIITATTGDLLINSNAGTGALIVNMGAGSQLNSTLGSVQFNQAAAGAITVTGGPANGIISAALFANFNGGASAVNVNVADITACVSGSGSPFNISVGSGNISIGGITTAGNINLIAPNNLTICGNCIAGGTVTLTSGTGAANFVQLNAFTVQGTSVTVNAPTFANFGTVTATTGNVLLQSNTAGGALAVNMGAASQLTSNLGAVNFNPTAGAITVTGGPANGTISAATTVLFNGGIVDVNVNTITGSVSGSGSTFNVTTGASTLSVSNISSTGAIALSNAGTGITKAGLVSGTSVTLLASGVGALIQHNGTTTATAGSIDLQAASGTVIVADASILTAFNNITINGGNGVNLGVGVGGVTLNAGLLTPGSEATLTLLPVGSALANGVITITAAGATSDINIGTNTTLTSRGGLAAGNGNLSVTAGRNIAVSSGVILTAWGGDLILKSDGGDVQLGSATQLRSIGKLTDSGGTFTTTAGEELPNYTGGRVGIFAGLPAANVSTELQGLVDTRSPTNQVLVDAGIAFDTSSPNLQLVGGSIVRAQISGGTPTVQVDPASNNIYSLTGGVVYINADGNTVIAFTGNTITAVGPPIAPLPPPPSTTTPAAAAPTTISVSTPDSIIQAPSGLSFALNSPALINQGVPTDRIYQPINFPSSQLTAPIALTLSSQGYVTIGGDESFVLPQSGTLIVGDQNTSIMLSAANTLHVNDGRIAAMVGTSELIFVTNHGIVRATPGSVVLVDSSNSGVTRVINFSGIVSFALADAPTKNISVAVGKELAVGSASGTIASKYSSNLKAVDTAAPGSKLAVFSGDVDLNELLAVDALLRCNGADDCPTARRLQALRNSLRKDIGTENAPLKPIAYKTSTVTTAANSKIETASSDYMVVKNADAQLKLQNDKLVLTDGEIVVATSRLATVQAGEHTIRIAGGTIALISKYGSVIKVRNLWEPGAGTIVIHSAKHSVSICAGHEVVVGNDPHTVYQAMQQDNVGRRRVRELTLGTKAMSTAEISIVSVMKESHLLDRLRASDEKSDKALVNRMMKMAACLQHATVKHGQYNNLQR